MRDEMGFGGFFWSVLTLAIAIYLGYVIVNTVTNQTYQDGYTARYNTYQREETARVQAQEETARVQSAQWNATLQQWAWPSAAGAILIVVAVQAGRTFRHRESERTKRQALLAWYVSRILPAGSHAEIGMYRGELAVIDHDSGEIIPYEVAQLELRQSRLLTG